MNLTDCVKAKLQNQLISNQGYCNKVGLLLCVCFQAVSVSRITAAAFYPFMELV